MWEADSKHWTGTSMQPDDQNLHYVRSKAICDCYIGVVPFSHTGWPKNRAHFVVRLNFVRFNFIKYWPIFILSSPSESGKHSQ